MFKSELYEPLYPLLPNGQVSDGSADTELSFFQEYHYKLKHLYSKFFTKRAAQIAQTRQAAAAVFYENLLAEVQASHALGSDILKHHLK